jgi:tetratricopeptide (TPR) repeat protein
MKFRNSPWKATEAIAVDSAHLPDDLHPASHDFFADLSDDDFTLPPPDLETGNVTDKYTFDGMFSRFKESLDQQVEEGDTETHYNLGIAYMEMGLFDDAIKEFRTAGKDPGRRTDCHTLQAVCCREKGDFAEAERLFRSEISGNGLDADRLLSLHYELGLLYEAAGRKDDALKSYREVFGVNPGYRDTMKKIARLGGKNSSFDLSDIDDDDIELEEIR